MTNEEHMLTTFDNPYNPFTHYKEWYNYDLQAGHDTSGLLARLVFSSEGLSESDQSLAIEEAIDFILREDVEGIYRKVKESDKIIALTEV